MVPNATPAIPNIYAITVIPSTIASSQCTILLYSTEIKRIWIGDSFVSLVSTPSKISIQNPILMVELGNQRRSNPTENHTWNEVEEVVTSETSGGLNTIFQ